MGGLSLILQGHRSLPYAHNWQGMIRQNNQNRPIIEINLQDTLCNEGVLPAELSLLNHLGEIYGAPIRTI